MTYNTKNYTEQGGEKTVIGGVLEIKEGATVTGLDTTGNGYTLPVAAADTLGGVKAEEKTQDYTVEVKIDQDGKLFVPVQQLPSAQAQEDSVATTIEGLVTDFNLLLENLRGAGLIQEEEQE